MRKNSAEFLTEVCQNVLESGKFMHNVINGHHLESDFERKPHLEHNKLPFIHQAMKVNA